MRAGQDAQESAALRVQEQTGLRVTAVRTVDCAYRYSILEQQGGDFAPVYREVLERVYLAFVQASPPVRAQDDGMECRWFSFGDALESLEWLEHAEALQKCHAILGAMTAPLSLVEIRAS